MDSKKSEIELRALLWMTVGGENLGGPGRIELLARIAECGSITQAAKAMKISYKAAWDAVNLMNNLAGQAIVERATGGRGGGSTHLTRRGERLVASFRVLEQEHRRFVAELSHQARGLEEDLVLIRRMGMKTSARNQFWGKVMQVKQGAVNDEIELEVLGSQRIVAVITHESAENLGLQEGTEAFALIKSSSILLMTGDEGAKLSARNRLSGTISCLQLGAVNAEVILELPGGGTVTSIITKESVAHLGLDIGVTASACFKASSVILGISA